MPGQCPFCFIDSTRIFHASELTVGLWDGFPVSPGHALLVPRRHVTTWFDASPLEQSELTAGIEIARQAILARHAPHGFNIGINVGAAGGQTVPHLHVHVIPRYAGDVADPRGGVRHVIPGKALYAFDEPLPLVHDGSARWATDSSLAKPSPAADTAAFGEKVLQLLDQGRFTATYKYAVLLALTDLCVERSPGPGEALSIPTRDLAARVLELYWPQTAPFVTTANSKVLHQNRGGQAEIVSAIRRLRERFATDPSEPLSRVRLRNPRRYEQLLASIEWKLIEMPLPRLQVVGEQTIHTLYRIGWDHTVQRGDIESNGFDKHLHLLPGVADNLVRLSALLRPLIQQSWAAMVAGMNRDASDEARLQEFLFGVDRIALDPVRADLRELQDNRCFYCEHPLAGQVDVDHFVPWARYPDNGIENLVVADAKCNGNKSDFLAAGEHVSRWVQRFEPHGNLAGQLADIATRAGWDRHPHRTRGVARAVYLRLPDEVRLWRLRREFTTVAAQRPLLETSLVGT